MLTTSVTLIIGSGSLVQALALAALAFVTLGGVRLMQWQIATRPRPALAAALRLAENLVRELAITLERNWVG